MTCKHCGTEIADKALICFRCGQATFEAQRRPPAAATGRRFGSLIVTLVLIVLMLGALFLGQLQSAFLADTVPDAVRWTIGVLAAIVLAWRLITQRRVRPRSRR